MSRSTLASLSPLALAFGAGAFALSVAACSITTNEGSSSGSSGGASSSSGSSGGASSSSGGSSSSSGGSSFKSCSPSGSTCTDAEYEPYTTCTLDACNAQYEACYGSGYRSGQMGGACATYMGCVAKCDCGDSACSQACGLPDQACMDCIKPLAACVEGANCKVPECAKASGGGGGGGAGKTCAELEACCAGIGDASKKAQCQQQAGLVKSSGDAACNALYAQYAADCP